MYLQLRRLPMIFVSLVWLIASLLCFLAENVEIYASNYRVQVKMNAVEPLLRLVSNVFLCSRMALK